MDNNNWRLSGQEEYLIDVSDNAVTVNSHTEVYQEDNALRTEGVLCPQSLSNFRASH